MQMYERVSAVLAAGGTIIGGLGAFASNAAAIVCAVSSVVCAVYGLCACIARIIIAVRAHARGEITINEAKEIIENAQNKRD